MTVQRSTKTFDAGAMLAEAGAPVREIYLIRQGSVSAPLPSDRRNLVFGPGTLIGLRDIIEGTAAPKFYADVSAVSPVVVEVLDADDVAKRIKGLSPRLKTCLVALTRTALRILETNQQTEKRVSRVVAKTKRELDMILDGHDADAETRDALDALLVDRDVTP